MSRMKTESKNMDKKPKHWKRKKHRKINKAGLTCIVREEGRKKDHRPQQRRTFGATKERAQQKAHIDHSQTERLEVNEHINFVAVLEHAAAGDQGDQDGNKGHLNKSGNQPR